METHTLRIAADDAARDLMALNVDLETHCPVGPIHMDLDLVTQEVVLRWEEPSEGTPEDGPKR